MVKPLCTTCFEPMVLNKARNRWTCADCRIYYPNPLHEGTYFAESSEELLKAVGVPDAAFSKLDVVQPDESAVILDSEEIIAINFLCKEHLAASDLWGGLIGGGPEVQTGLRGIMAKMNAASREISSRKLQPRPGPAARPKKGPRKAPGRKARRSKPQKAPVARPAKRKA